MTDGEKRLWRELPLFKGNYGVHVRRQVPIGPYIVDFAIIKHMLIIELDGEHHFTPNGLQRDACRDAYLVPAGYRIVRINTGELAENLDGCIDSILHTLRLA